MKMLKKLVRGGAVASSKKMAPALGGAAAASKGMQPALGGAVAAAKTAQPMVAQAAKMPNQAPLGGLRSAVKTAATNVKAAVEKQPALQKPAIGAALQKKPVGRMIGGLSSKFLKRR
jgi:hypothetical protein